MSERLKIDRFIIPISEGSDDHLNMLTLKLTVGEDKINFPRLDANVLALIMDNPGSITTRKQIGDELWPGWSLRAVNRSLYMYIPSIRTKLKKLNLDKCFVTHPREGFEWDIEKK